MTRFIERLLCGQQKDLDSNKIEKTIDNYYAIAYGKTGALLNMACLFGSMPYSYNKDKTILITEFANSLAVCYQILDDLNDVKKSLPLDSSNICYFVKDNNQIDCQIVHRIERIMDLEWVKLSEIVRRLHYVGILKTKITDGFLNELFEYGKRI